MLALLQFDATNAELVGRLVAEGKLPAIAELRQRGRRLRLERKSPLFVEAGSYVTLYSGRDVGDHGIYSAFLWSAEEQRIRFMNRFPPPPAVWDHLGRAGRRSLVIDPYESWPPAETAGLRLLNGWQFRHKLLLHIARPRGLQTALSIRNGPAPAIEHQYGRQQAARLRRVRPRLLRAPGRAAAAVEQLARRSRPDLIWITFSAAHFAGHYYWDPVQAIDEELDPSTRSELESTLEDSHRAVDAAIGRVIRALPRDADVIVFSPIGMGPETSRSDLLPQMLRAVLDADQQSAGPMEADLDARPGGAIWKLRASLPMSLRIALARPLPRVLVRNLTSALHLRGTDWSRTRAFALPGDHSGYIRFNLRGREREGIVDPADVDALAAEISAGLRSFRDPDGSPAVASVDRVSESIGGERSGQLPDLVVTWPDVPSLGLGWIESERHGRITRVGVGTGRTGNHTTDGWAVVAPGTSGIRELPRSPGLDDLAATACALLGAEAPGTGGEPILV